MLCETTNEMEMAVISSLVNNPGQYHIIGNIISADTFYNTKHQYIYKAKELLINKNISFLEKSFENDTEKIQLLQTLSFVVNLQKNGIEFLPPKKDKIIKEDRKTGFWEKLKGLFKK